MFAKGLSQHQMDVTKFTSVFPGVYPGFISLDGGFQGSGSSPHYHLNIQELQGIDKKKDMNLPSNEYQTYKFCHKNR